MAENTIMSFRETGTTNAVKILPTIQNINNYIGITTELDSHIQVGDIVYITYRYDEYSSNTLDNYLDYFHDTGYPFIDYVNGYEVKEVQLENNLIIIDKPYGNLSDNYQILEHYLSIKSFNLNQTENYISIAKIDSTLFKNVYINSTSSSNIDLQQAYILSGTIKNTNFKDKYYFKYLSLNTSSSGSTYSYNNNKYGYTYCYGTSTNYIYLESCIIDNGRFYYTNVSLTTINEGYFENCNLSMTNFGNASLKGLSFINCKISGTDFGVAADFMFAVSFDGCVLDYANFYKKKMPKTAFKDCRIREATFSAVDLAGATFNKCDLGGTIFRQNTLDGVDFSNAENYQLDPSTNSLRKAKFSYPSVLGLLAKYDIIIE